MEKKHIQRSKIIPIDKLIMKKRSLANKLKTVIKQKYSFNETYVYFDPSQVNCCEYYHCETNMMLKYVIKNKAKTKICKEIYNLAMYHTHSLQLTQSKNI